MFLTNLQAVSDERNPSDDFWFQPGAALGHTQSGAVVTAETAMRLSTVFKVIKVISETIGMLPMHMYQALGPQQRERMRAHPVARLLSSRPNQWQTPMQFRQMLEAHRSLRGNGYARIYWADNGDPEMIVPLHPDRVTVEVAANGLPRYQVRSQDGTRTETLLQGEVFHLVGLTLDGYVGINPTVGAQGDIALVDWKSYRTITKSGGIETATSMHLWFDLGMTAFRAVFRVAGQPAVTKPITPNNGSNTLSPFVVLDLRA